MASEPLHVLMKAIVAKWATVTALDDAISGPWQGERPPDAKGNPASGTPSLYPYCIISGEAEMAVLTCGTEYWDHRITLRVYDKSEKDCHAQAVLIGDVFDSDSLTLTMDHGVVVSHRPLGRRYMQDDKTVWFCEMTYFFQTTRVRVA